MKNKNLLLLAGALLLLGACKREITPPDYDSENQVISLTSGAVLGRAANVGMREQFEAGDQIGVFALYATTPTDGTNPMPRWDTAAHFENTVAAFVSNNTATPIVTSFGWGPAAEGQEFNKYYPAKKRQIFLCSYYPYVAAGVGSNYIGITPEAATDEKRQPKLKVELMHGPIGVSSAEDVLLKQPDILHYFGATPISSAVPTSTLTYNHALAQIRFTVKRPDNSAPCKFVKLVFKTTAKGVLNLATGEFAYDAAEADLSNRRDAVYTIELADTTKSAIPEKGSDPFNYLDVLNPDKDAKFNYLMVLPLVAAEAEKSDLKLTCDFGVGDVPNIRQFNIPLTGSLTNWTPGKLNTLAINVEQFTVTLSASITPWAEGDVIELPAE